MGPDPPYALGLAGKVGLYLSRAWELVSADPRESNTEGGIFPAIFGTVMMVFLMSFAVAPLGATRFETLRRVVVPAAAPGILTGMILAMARAASEVAPLMIVGMVKLAPTLPIDEHFPFIHPERKFMHLGFHIYDVGSRAPTSKPRSPWSSPPPSSWSPWWSS